VRKQIDLSNGLAAALTADQEALLRALERQLDTGVFLRGNRLTLDGEAGAVEDGRRTVEELERLSERGHGLSEATIASVRGELGAERSPAQLLDDVVWTHRGRRIAPKTVDRALRRRDPREHDHLRHRPGRHRQDFPRGRRCRRGAVAP